MIVRAFDTAVEAPDLERAQELFRTVVRPAFEGFSGCHGIEMLVGIDEHSMDLIEIVAISRWDSQEAIDEAVSGDDYEEALREIRKLFQQTPLVRHFEAIE